MNYEVLFKIEKEENAKIMAELIETRKKLTEEERFNELYSRQAKKLKRDIEMLTLSIEELKKGSGYQREKGNHNENLVKKIIIETYA